MAREIPNPRLFRFLKRTSTFNCAKKLITSHCRSFRAIENCQSAPSLLNPPKLHGVREFHPFFFTDQVEFWLFKQVGLPKDLLSGPGKKSHIKATVCNYFLRPGYQNPWQPNTINCITKWLPVCLIFLPSSKHTHLSLLTTQKFKNTLKFLTKVNKYIFHLVRGIIFEGIFRILLTLVVVVKG